jgi:guanylate kinase
MRIAEGLLVVVSSPAGCGKGTVLNNAFAKDPNLFYSVSAATRVWAKLRAKIIILLPVKNLRV